MPLEGPPQEETSYRKKEHLNEQQNCVFYNCNAPPACSPPHPQVRRQARSGHMDRAGFRAWLYQPAARSHPSHSPSRPTHNPAAWLSRKGKTYYASTGQPAKSIVFRTTVKTNIPRGCLFGHCPSAQPGCLLYVWCSWDTLRGYNRSVTQSFPRIDGLPLQEGERPAQTKTDLQYMCAKSP